LSFPCMCAGTVTFGYASLSYHFIEIYILFLYQFIYHLRNKNNFGAVAARQQ